MLTRRVVLTGGVGCALALILPKQALADPQSPHAHKIIEHHPEALSDLFVFRGSEPDTTVMAVTWVGNTRSESALRLHAGARSWDVAIPDHSSSRHWESGESRIFAGNVLNRADGRFRNVVVVESPSQSIGAGDHVGIWAERFDGDGLRFRTGSPFLAEIAARDSELSRLYHASSPGDDGHELARLVGRSVAANARVSGYLGDPDQYGRRIASVITPDVLRYSPTRPVGFTFAAQNGRHPNDASQAVVDTVLNGAVRQESMKPKLLLQIRFPYFS